MEDGFDLCENEVFVRFLVLEDQFEQFKVFEV